MPDITPREWRWLGAASLAVLALFSIPYLVGWQSATPTSHFSGFLLGLEDMYSYIAKMRYGARDGWDFHLVYTSEPHAGGYVFLPFLALGKLTMLITGQGASISADALIAAFHVFRLVCGALLLGVVYVFVAHFFVEPSQRRTAWAIASVGGGFGWLEAIFQTTLGTAHLPPVEFYIPEAFTSLILFSLPHLALARALLLAGWLAMFVAAEKKSWRSALVAGGMWFGMSLCVPFFAGLLGIVVALWLAGLWIATQRLPLHETGLAVVAGVLPALYVAYNAWLFSTNPIFAIWSSQNVLPSPPVFEYVIAYGLLAALAVPGAVRLVRRGLDPRTRLLVIWPVAGLLMVYLPINVQRRLLEGMIVPLAILAAMGLAWMWNIETSTRRIARVIAAGLALLLIISSLFFVLGETAVAGARSPAAFHTDDELIALEWLGEHAPPDSIVLSTHQSGTMLPAYAPVRVFVGHGPETIHSREKAALAKRFFGGGMDDMVRLTLLDDHTVRFVWIGREEQTLACQTKDCFSPGRLGLVQVFQAGDFSIYQVAP